MTKPPPNQYNNHMNLFYLHTNPQLAAQYHNDKHTIKMILETAQLLSTAHHTLDQHNTITGIYKPTHPNHPTTIWTRTTLGNYTWTHQLAQHLLTEYTKRYNKTHKTTPIIQTLTQPPKNIPPGPHTPPPQAMPPQYQHPNTVTAYRNYYKHAKNHIATWKTQPPPWWNTQ